MSTKNVQIDKELFITALEGLNRIRLDLESKIVEIKDEAGVVTKTYSPIVVQNYSKQGMGNRVLSCDVKCTVTYGKGEGNRTFSIRLGHGWMPARDNTKVGIDEFKGANVATSHTNAGDYWKLFSTRGVKTPHLETTALIAYFIDQLATAGIVSGEGSVKALYLKHLIDSCHVSNIEVELMDVGTQPFPYKINFIQIKRFLEWAEWRADAIKAVPYAGKSDQVSKNNRLVKINVDVIPPEFDL